MRVFFVFAFVALVTIPSFSQENNRNVIHYDELNGNNIFDVYSDSHGYIWMATHNGLLRFDGYEFKRYYYDPNDSSSISTVLTSTLFEDSKGRLWIGGVNDINLLDPSTGKFKRYSFVALTGMLTSLEPLISTIEEDKNGSIIFGVSANYSTRSPEYPLLTIDEKKDVIVQAEYPGSEVLSAIYYSAKDPLGNIWLIIASGIAKINIDGTIERIPLPDGTEYASGITTSGDGAIWISSNKPVLHRYDPVAKVYSAYPLPVEKKDQLQTQISSIFSDTDKRVWIGTNSGVYFLDPMSDHVEIFDAPVKDGVSLSQVTSFAEDAFGNIWMGTFSNGLFRVEKRSAFRSMLGDGQNNRDLLAGWADPITEGSDGKLWVVSTGLGRDNSGLSIVDLKSGLAQHHTFSSLDDKLFGLSSIHEYDPGVMIICTYEGLKTLSMSDLKLLPVNTGGLSDSVYLEYYFRDSKGTEWIGTRGYGLLERRQGQDEFLRHNLLELSGSTPESNDVIELVESPKHGLWILTNGGLFLYDYASKTFARHGNDPKKASVFLSQDINTLYDDEQGTVWVGTWQGGLIRYSLESGALKTYTINEGLPSMGIQKIIYDVVGNNLWISTFDGLCRFDLAADEISSFSTDDGIHGQLFSDGAGLITKDGLIVFGGSNGITYFEPGNILSNSIPPSVFLTGFKASNSSEEISDGIIEADIIELNYDQNNISLAYNGIHFSNPSRNKFEYRLEGYDAEWRQVGNQRSAYYTNLPPGDYTFRVRASNNNGVWNEEGATLRLIIAPPWWKTPWAYGLYALSFVGLVFVTDRYQRNRVIRREREHAREKELKQAREIERAYNVLKTTQEQLIQSEKMASLGELTAGIAHEIQNPLNFVNNFSEVSKELLEEMKSAMKSNNPEEANTIADSVIHNLEKILHHGKRADGIVKGMLLHSRGSSGAKELVDINVLTDEYLRLAYHGLRAKDNFFDARIDTDFDQTLGKIEVVPQDIGRVILNLITNAFHAVTERKRSEEGFQPVVSVKTKAVGEAIEISIRDNGNGIPRNVLDKIFQPFFTTKPAGHGTGLGLSLSYDIVKAHGGVLKVETKEREGSVFIIELPVV